MKTDFEPNIIDTFPTFLDFWETVQHQTLDAQIDGWASFYLAQWPELLEKQVQNYAELGMDWRQVAKERVVPFWEVRLPAMAKVHGNFLEIIPKVHKCAQEILGFEQAFTYVVYVGIGCGAGWATQYQDNAAILFGLENIAEEEWDDAVTLKGLASHEIGHLWHFEQRLQAECPTGEGPWWDLYTEGVAQRCEHLIAGEDTWHMAAQRSDWISWCKKEQQWLVKEFLRVVDEGGDIRTFFGSWFEVRGYKQTGYFLGHEAVRRLEQQMTLQEIALVVDVEALISDVVHKMAEDDA